MSFQIGTNRRKHYYGSGLRYTYILDMSCIRCKDIFFIRESVAKESTGKCRGCRSTKHGMRNSREYNIWYAMRERCEKPYNKYYKNYGGRGIKVCDSWTDFINFFEDMGKKPNNKTLDRINNDGGYSKENCRWATCNEQSNNKRNNRMLTHNNKTQTVKEWSDELNIKYDTLSKRINRLGWPTEKALKAD